MLKKSFKKANKNTSLVSEPLQVSIEYKENYDLEKFGELNYATEGSAGFDLKAAIDKPITIKNNQVTLIPTGIAVSIPTGYYMQISMRSGLALKAGLILVNGVGVIDSDYRGEIGLIMSKITDGGFLIEPGDRVAQAVILPYCKAEFNKFDTLDITDRGNGGFGSTGKNKSLT